LNYQNNYVKLQTSC